MKVEQIRAAVDRILQEEFEVEPGRIQPAAQLGPGLGLDSLDGVDLVVALEKEFKLRITETEAKAIRTVGDIYDRVASRCPAVEGGDG